MTMNSLESHQCFSLHRESYFKYEKCVIKATLYVYNVYGIEFVKSFTYVVVSTEDYIGHKKTVINVTQLLHNVYGIEFVRVLPMFCSPQRIIPLCMKTCLECHSIFIKCL